MIRHSLAGAFLSLALFMVPALAQPAPTPEHLKVAREVVISSGLSQSIESLYSEFVAGVRQNLTTRPELRKDTEEVLAALKPEADLRRDEMIDSSARIFASKMTEADLKEVAAFFASSVGQRYNSFRTQALDEIFTVLQPWSTATSNRLYDLFQAEMRKRGHQL
ncbi:DUF2059 domain-containing protein [Bosea vestrisii]|uniref:DUF2059 domain-containing protein n=1 Tax=Bosea vestrisii TaxID=151416 RepID=UPI0024DFEAC8|nr:DUF2059 domain-containing protein [Bosea vestrisii]WID96161.1 DUF2059 domain-containing protein [Bosea vestrisii]